jgi:hypothetical protein
VPRGVPGSRRQVNTNTDIFIFAILFSAEPNHLLNGPVIPKITKAILSRTATRRLVV